MVERGHILIFSTKYILLFITVYVPLDWILWYSYGLVLYLFYKEMNFRVIKCLICLDWNSTYMTKSQEIIFFCGRLLITALANLNSRIQYVWTSSISFLFLVKIPKCKICTEPIFDQFVLKVEDKFFHIQCLKCDVCEIKLSDKCYNRDDKAYCKEDFFK